MFYFVNLCFVIDCSEIGIYYVFNGYKMENVMMQKEKKIFEDLKKLLRICIFF